MIDDFMTRRDSGWYDKQGNQVSMLEWAELTKDQDYRIVEQTSCGFWWVSTVLLGLDHGHRNFIEQDPAYHPVIFETMVFTRWKTYRRGYTFGGLTRPGYWSSDSVDENRYCTLAQAKGGHLDMVHKWRGWNGFKRFIAYWLGVL